MGRRFPRDQLPTTGRWRQGSREVRLNRDEDAASVDITSERIRKGVKKSVKKAGRGESFWPIQRACQDCIAERKRQHERARRGPGKTRFNHEKREETVVRERAQMMAHLIHQGLKGLLQKPNEKGRTGRERQGMCA